MSLNALVDPFTPDDTGGVAGRIGYDYQAHVAASFVLDMIADPELIQVECETADDVTLRWERVGLIENEYVQVKTTDADSKWGIGELTARTKSNIGSSVMEKSLFCDRFPGISLFRFVSPRDVRGNLAPLQTRRENRKSSNVSLQKVVDRIGAKYNSFKSPNGKSTKYWAQNMLWDVEPSVADIERKNILKLLRQAEDKGERASSDEAESAYDNLLKSVSLASIASRVREPQAKVITRVEALEWWGKWLEKFRTFSIRQRKVYNATQDPFFVMISDISELTIKRSMQAFDAEFDGGEWRRDDLARYLCDWLPEIVLPPKVLASFTHLEARGLTASALNAFRSSDGIEVDRLLAELMLNAVLRQYRQSEPISCKLFTKSLGVVHKSSAHIVHTSQSDEIWLGQAKMAAAGSHDEVVAQVIKQVGDTFDRDILKREREVIVQLRDPDHLKSTNIEKALSKNAKLDDFLDVLRIPVLIAYDSDVISEGDKPGYVAKLVGEVGEFYDKLKTSLPTNVLQANVCIFLIPVECVVSLTKCFKDHLDGT